MLEVCVDSIESALAAVKGGCSRLELCSALSEGGLTPTPGTLKTLKNLNIEVPIFCMLRPRRGNDFNYSNEEIQGILYDLDILMSSGADGFVFGALDDNKKIDFKQCQKIIENCKNIPVTFHRAFDLTDPKDMEENLNLIKSLGFKRILTSGYKQTAEIGLENLKKLTTQCSAIGTDLIIMPGAGIGTNNIENILTETNCKEIHASARVKKEISNACSDKISMGGTDADAEPIYVTDSNIVKELVKISKLVMEN